MLIFGKCLIISWIRQNIIVFTYCNGLFNEIERYKLKYIKIMMKKKHCCFGFEIFDSLICFYYVKITPRQNKRQFNFTLV